MDILLSVRVVFPLLVYLVIGIICGKAKIISPSTSSQINKLVFRVLFPVTMFDNIVNAGETLKNSNTAAAPFYGAVVFIAVVLMLVIVPLFIKDKARLGSFIQGSFRSNSILFAIPVATVLCGGDTGMASVCLALVVPEYNILAVIVLELCRGGKINFLRVLRGVVTNPFIIGAFVGFLYMLTGLPLPELVQTPIKALGGCVTPIALIALGAGLKFSGIRRDFRHLCAVSAIKLFLIPLATVVGAVLIGFDRTSVCTVFAMSCVPTAVGSFPMAEQMGADGPFAGEIVAFTTIASMLTVFLWVLALSGLHII